ncbi:MAG: HEAT repeat domain-containing protein, partial [Chloroflexota bacterium]
HIAKLNTQGLNNGISKHLEQLSLHGGEAGKIAHTPLLVQLLVFLESNHCLEDIQNIGQVLAQYLQIALCEDIASLHVHGHAHALAILAANLLDHHNALALDRVSLGNIDEATINHGLRYGVLVAENDTIGFSHILIRDALAALYLLHYGLYTRLVYPTFLSPGKRVSRPWDRPLIFAAMVTRSNDSILREIADVDPLLAAIAVDQGVQANDGTQQAILRALLKLFDRHTNLDRDQIFKSLEWLSNVEAINQLVDTLYEEKANLTDEGSTMSLKSLGNNTVRLLIEIMRGDRWQRRRKAAWALGNIQEPSAIPELVQALRDENESVRREADYALARIGQPAIPALVEGLNESDPDMRAAIIKILGRIGDPSTVPHITACLNDTEWPRTEEVRVCDLAAIALEHISTEDAHAAVDSWKGTSKSAAKTSNWKARVKSSQPVNGRQQLPLEIVLERTGDADWSIRRDAARELRYHDPELALPHLLKLLADEDAQVRWAAVNSLAQFSGDVVIQGLTTALHDEDYRIVDSAAHSLAQLGETAIPDLIAALAEKNPNVRAAAAEALGVIGNDTAIPHLADALADTTRPAWEQHRVCDIAATALERIGTEQALFTLQQWRKEQKAFVTQFNRVNDPESLLQLDEINGSQDDISQQRSAIIRFLDALQESDWHSQQQAARSLREYAATLQGQEDHRAVVRLAEAINDKAAIVRWTAAEAMAWLDAEDVLPSLMQALDDNSWTVRTAAVRALAAQGDTAAVPELIKKLQDDHPLVREAAAETLGRIADTRARDSLLNALTDNDEFVRRAAVEALGNMGNSTASAVSEMLNDSSLTVRFAAIENLGKNKAAAFVDALIPLLNDTTKPDWDDRRICDLAAAALQNIDTQQAARALDNWHQNGN